MSFDHAYNWRLRLSTGWSCAQPGTNPITSGFPCLDPPPTDERSQFEWLDFHRVLIGPRSVSGCEKFCRILPKAASFSETWLNLSEIWPDLNEISAYLEEIKPNLNKILPDLFEFRLDLGRSDRKHRRTTIIDGERWLSICRQSGRLKIDFSASDLPTNPQFSGLGAETHRQPSPVLGRLILGPDRMG